MIIERVFTPGLAQVAYLVGDESSGKMAVIDPRRDVDEYVRIANERGMEITAILETHVHADFVSGALELAEITGAPIYSSRLGAQEFDHTPLDDGDTVPLGTLLLETFWTPGHTPEHIGFLLIDPAQRPEPVAFFTGDLLFVGEVGRPDLLGKAHTGELAHQLYETIATRLPRLKDDVVVYPGHTAGSSCGKKIGEAPHSTMANERIGNYALRPMSEPEFIDSVMTGMPIAPSYYPTMKRVNKLGPALVRDLPDGTPLTVAEASEIVESGGLIVDARSESAYDAAHIPGSFFAGSEPDFVNWIGWFAPYDRPLILLLADDAEYAFYRNELRRIGLDAVSGFLEGGIEAWKAAGQPTEALQSIEPTELFQTLQQRESIRVVDVRSDEEWREGHIDGAVHHYVGRITQGAALPLDAGDPVVLTCQSGLRSRVAASLLQNAGYGDILNVDGGIDAWQAAGLPVVTS